MKNKLLVSVFALAIAAIAFTSCKHESDVTEVCEDLVKVSLHKSARSLLQLKGETLTVSEYEFPSQNVNDNRLVFRTITFGNGVYEPKKVDMLTYEYGEWNEDYTKFSLYVTPSNGEPLWYMGNALITSDGRVYGGEGSNNTARVEKFEKAINNFSNTDWEATFMDEITYDSIFDIRIDTIALPPTFDEYRYDTIKTFVRLDPIAADTTCKYEYAFNRNATTYANTGSCILTSTRSKFDPKTRTADTISVDVKVYDIKWYFSEVSSDSKFTIVWKSTTAPEQGDELSISKFKLDSVGVASEFLLKGLTFKRPQND